MRASVSRLALALGILAAGTALGAPPKAPHETPSLTLYEKADFTGRHVSFHGQAETAREAFDAKSAKSTGLWTLCEGRDPASKCQTVNGPVAKLKITPGIVRPGVEAVALYEEPGLKGRRVVYSFASDQPPPFRAKSARTWGGAWSLCDGDGGHCQVVDGEHPEAVDVKVARVTPGRPQERLQLALAAPRPAPPPEPEVAEAAPPPEAAPPAAEVALAQPPPPPEAAPEPEDMPPPVLAEAAPPPQEAERSSPYVDIPLPPRERDAPPRQEIAPPPPAEPPVVQIPIPAPQADPSAGPVRRVAYVCEGGQGLTVLFDDRDQSAMVLAGGQNPVALRRTQAEDAGGFFYEGSGHVLFGAGGRAGYASDGAEPIDCYTGAARRQLTSRDEPRREYEQDDRGDPD